MRSVIAVLIFLSCKIFAGEATVVDLQERRLQKKLTSFIGTFVRLEDSLEPRVDDLYRISLSTDEEGSVLALDHWKSGVVERFFSARLEELPAGQSSLETSAVALWLMGSSGSETYGRSITAKARKTLILTNRTRFIHVGLMNFGRVDALRPVGTLVKVDLSAHSALRDLILEVAQRYNRGQFKPGLVDLSPLAFVSGTYSDGPLKCSTNLTVQTQDPL